MQLYQPAIHILPFWGEWQIKFSITNPDNGIQSTSMSSPNSNEPLTSQSTELPTRGIATG